MTGDDETPRFRRQPRGVGMDSSQRRRAPAVVDDEATSPYDLLEREPSREAHELAQRIGRPSDAPVTVEQVAEILLHMNRRFRRADESAQQRAIEQVRELITHPPDEAFRDVKRKVDGLEAIRKWVAGALAGIVLAVGYFLWDASAAYQRLRSEVEQLRRDSEEHRQELRSLRRNKGTEP